MKRGDLLSTAARQIAPCAVVELGQSSGQLAQALWTRRLPPIPVEDRR
jgi:hypothetical protein